MVKVELVNLELTPMHGTIIHYDTLTQCGLLRTEAGQLHYFRRDEVAEATGWSAGRYVALRTSALADTGGSQMDVVEGIAAVRSVEQARRGVAPKVVAPPQRGPYAWVGGWLALASLLCLLLSGGTAEGYGSSNPKLTGSIFGVAAAGLLTLLAILFFTHKKRSSIRWIYWLAAWSSLFAYVGQTFDGFEVDTPATLYAYSLIALFFGVYLAPKK